MEFGKMLVISFLAQKINLVMEKNSFPDYLRYLSLFFFHFSSDALLL